MGGGGGGGRERERDLDTVKGVIAEREIGALEEGLDRLEVKALPQFECVGGGGVRGQEGCELKSGRKDGSELKR